MNRFMKMLASVAVASGMVMLAQAAQNFAFESGTVSYANAGAAIASGDVVDVGSRYGIAVVDIASNATGTVMVKGVWYLTLATNETITLDTKLYWDATADQVTAAATTGTFIGLAAEAKTTTTNTALIAVDLNAVARQVIVSAVTNVTQRTAAITATATFTPQTVSITDTNGVTIAAVTNGTIAVTIVNGGTVVTNITTSAATAGF